MHESICTAACMSMASRTEVKYPGLLDLREIAHGRMNGSKPCLTFEVRRNAAGGEGGGRA